MKDFITTLAAGLGLLVILLFALIGAIVMQPWFWLAVIAFILITKL